MQSTILLFSTDAMHNRNYAVARCPSVRQSVTLPRSDIVSKQLVLPSEFIHPLAANEREHHHKLM